MANYQIDEGMTQDECIAQHLAEHDRKVEHKRKARLASEKRKSKRGLDAAIARMMQQHSAAR